ncbi:MAG: gluconate 2-dehydrogenase subunit 3 family protein, partial [Candidatus Neomarinimicrobiota bacterium]
MNRREALKNISISFGSITLSAGVLSTLQSCQSNNSDWSPEFFSEKQLNLVDRMFEIIIPETDTPGAISLNLSNFVDSYIHRNIPSKNQSELSAEINEFLNIILKNESKNNISEVDDISLEKYLSN